MPDKKSTIESFSVSFGKTEIPSVQQKNLEKWHILVCSDLGFLSPSPLPLRISNWNEFIASQNIVLSGTVHDTAEPAKTLGYVEIPFQTVNDLTFDAIIKNADPFVAFYKTCFALEQLCDGKTDIATCIAMIEKAGLPKKEVNDVLAVLSGGVPQKTVGSEPKETTNHSSIDAILSMVDCGNTQNDDTTGKSHLSALDALFAAVSKDGAVMFNKDAILAYCKSCKDGVSVLANACMDEPWFKSRQASWKSLKLLSQTIGRKHELQLHVASMPFEDAFEGFEKLLLQCNNAGCLPDIVVFDYPLSFSNANVDRLKKISLVAEKYKTVICSSLNDQEYVSLDLVNRDSVADTFSSPRFLPYKAFREQSESRCVCLSASGFCIHQNESSVLGTGSYYIAIRFADALLSFCDPFIIKDPLASDQSIFAESNLFHDTMTKPVIRECKDIGLTIFSGENKVLSIADAVVVVSEQTVAKRYTSFLFNVLVNRIVRLCGLFILSLDKNLSVNDKAMLCANYVKKELMPYHVLRLADQVSASVLADGAMEIIVNSDNVICGETICFSFSF